MIDKEYYEFYLNKHQNPKCRLLHFIGQWATLLFIGFIIYGLHWYLIPLIPFIVYPFAWAGHRVFEKNKPLAIDGLKDGGRTTIKAKICDMIMFLDILKGKISIW